MLYANTFEGNGKDRDVDALSKVVSATRVGEKVRKEFGVE